MSPVLDHDPITVPSCGHGSSSVIDTDLGSIRESLAELGPGKERGPLSEDTPAVAETICVASEAGDDVSRRLGNSRREVAQWSQWECPILLGFIAALQIVEFLFTFAILPFATDRYFTVPGILCFHGAQGILAWYFLTDTARLSDDLDPRFSQRSRLVRTGCLTGFPACALCLEYWAGPRKGLWSSSQARLVAAVRAISLTFETLFLIPLTFSLPFRDAEEINTFFVRWRVGAAAGACVQASSMAFSLSVHAQLYARFPSWKGFGLTGLFVSSDLLLLYLPFASIAFLYGTHFAVAYFTCVLAVRMAFVMTSVPGKATESGMSACEYLQKCWFQLLFIQPFGLLMNTFLPVHHPSYHMRWAAFWFRYLESILVLVAIGLDLTNRRRLAAWGLVEHFNSEYLLRIYLPVTLIVMYFHSYTSAAIASRSLPCLLHLAFWRPPRTTRIRDRVRGTRSGRSWFRGATPSLHFTISSERQNRRRENRRERVSESLRSVDGSSGGARETSEQAYQPEVYVAEDKIATITDLLLRGDAPVGDFASETATSLLPGEPAVIDPPSSSARQLIQRVRRAATDLQSERHLAGDEASSYGSPTHPRRDSSISYVSQLISRFVAGDLRSADPSPSNSPARRSRQASAWSIRNDSPGNTGH